MNEHDIEKRFDLIEKRIANIEKIVSEKKNAPTQRPKSESKESLYGGLTGGIRFLIDNNFFNTLRSKKEVHLELQKEGYYHRPEAVDTILRRDFVGKKKILTRINENGIWKYVVRK